MAMTSAQRQAALKARKQAGGLQLVANLWVKPENVPAVRAFAAGAGTLSATGPASAAGQVDERKAIGDASTETTEQLCASLKWQFSQLGDEAHRVTGQGVIKRILKTLKERAKHGH